MVLIVIRLLSVDWLFPSEVNHPLGSLEQFLVRRKRRMRWTAYERVLPDETLLI